MIAYTVAEVPKWNPINVCSYHLQEAGATPVQEVAFALCTAIAVLDCGARFRPGAAGGVRRGRRPHLVLRQRRRAVHRGDVQAARVRRAVGRDHPRALRRAEREAPAVPLRRAGQLAGADRGAAGEQRLPHPARDAGRDDVARTRAPAPSNCRPGTRRWACRARGTSSGRCACSRCSRSSPTCSSTTTCSRARPSSRPRSRRSRPARSAEIDRMLEHGRRGRRRRVAAT